MTHDLQEHTMLNPTLDQISVLLKDFNIGSKISAVKELQRDNYEECGLNAKNVRLILKIEFDDHPPVVVRLRNEAGLTDKLVEEQSVFAFLLCKNGIETPELYTADGHFSKRCFLNGYDVIATAERFMDNEVVCIDTDIAQATGELLAEMHNISEKNNCHVHAKVLFDPMTKNDLFGYKEFISLEEKLCACEPDLYKIINDKYNQYMEIISEADNRPRYAVQGDISHCNTYMTGEGKLGVFDFNWCGDNNLFFDAIMQAFFEAQLMDYAESCAENHESLILSAFLNGYNKKRPFSESEKTLYPYLYAIISAFELGFIKYDEENLYKALENGDGRAVKNMLTEIYRRLNILNEIPLDKKGTP